MKLVQNKYWDWWERNWGRGKKWHQLKTERPHQPGQSNSVQIVQVINIIECAFVGISRWCCCCYCCRAQWTRAVCCLSNLPSPLLLIEIYGIVLFSPLQMMCTACTYYTHITKHHGKRQKRTCIRRAHNYYYFCLSLIYSFTLSLALSHQPLPPHCQHPLFIRNYSILFNVLTNWCCLHYSHVKMH